MSARKLASKPFTCLMIFCAIANANQCLSQQDQSRVSERDKALRALQGQWLYCEDQTKGRETEKQQPPMSMKFNFRVEENAVVMERGTGNRKREEKISLDGSVREAKGNGSVSRYRGTWKDGVLRYETEIRRTSDNSRIAYILKEFTATKSGLRVHVVVGQPAQLDSVALYRHPEDIEMPKPAKAKIADVAWIAGAWVGTRGTSSVEERWSPIKGGAMLGISRTVKGDRMTAFEYLRIVERDGGLVYFAQPGGSKPTEFVLTELKAKRAVFVNPRHDFPQRIVYELSDDGRLTASIGFAKGGRPRQFGFEREDE